MLITSLQKLGDVCLDNIQWLAYPNNTGFNPLDLLIVQSQCLWTGNASQGEYFNQALKSAGGSFPRRASSECRI
ncbi:MAG: hypothetical protein PUP91_24835 [Rhizonema sp. PD37]|nr:hypothetical protein [Rhizonema sp. PD37]